MSWATPSVWTTTTGPAAACSRSRRRRGPTASTGHGSSSSTRRPASGGCHCFGRPGRRPQRAVGLVMPLSGVWRVRRCAVSLSVAAVQTTAARRPRERCLGRRGRPLGAGPPLHVDATHDERQRGQRQRRVEGGVAEVGVGAEQVGGCDASLQPLAGAGGDRYQDQHEH